MDSKSLYLKMIRMDKEVKLFVLITKYLVK